MGTPEFLMERRHEQPLPLAASIKKDRDRPRPKAPIAACIFREAQGEAVAVSKSRTESDRLQRVIDANAKNRGITFADAEAEFVSYVSMKTTVTTQQIADAILFLCSPRGRTISGQAISICGDVQMLF